MKEEFPLRYIYLIVQIGLVVVVCVLVGLGIGLFINRFAPSKIWIILFILIGVIAGVWNAYEMIIKELDKSEK